MPRIRRLKGFVDWREIVGLVKRPSGWDYSVRLAFRRRWNGSVVFCAGKPGAGWVFL
jgi:hypothetical protein